MNSSMELLCGSEFWNLNRTWYTNSPDFTECTHQTLLIWIPCAFIWLFVPYETFKILNSNGGYIPWSAINISKLVLNSMLVLLSVIYIGQTVLQRSNGIEAYQHDVHLVTPAVMTATFVLTLALLLAGRLRGIRSSGSLFIFWFLLTFFGAFTFKSRILSILNNVHDEGEFSFVVYYPIVVTMFVANFFADKEPSYRTDSGEKSDNPCPEERASFLSLITYQWFDSMVWRGYKKPLESSDLWDLNNRDKSKVVVPKFDKHWDKTLQENLPKSSEALVEYGTKDEKVNFKTSSQKKAISILPALCKTFSPQLLMAALIKVVHDLLSFVSPQILGLLIKFVDNPDEESWKGYFYAIILTAAAVVQTLFLGQYFQSMFVMGMQIKSVLVSAIYRKAIRISNSARKESTVGEIVNLMSVDAQRFMDITTYLNMIWSSPLQIGLALYFLYQILGASAFAGLGIMILLIPLNAMVANATKKLQIIEMKNKDKRVKLMNEILSGIKILKLYAWEPSYQNNIEAIRGKEIEVLKKSAFFNAGTTFLWTTAPFLVSCVSFMTFVWTGGVLTPDIAFVSLTLFNIIRMPMNVLPMLIAQFVQANVSLKRLNKFMSADELDPDNIFHDSSIGSAVKIQNASFTWDSEGSLTLKDINLEIESKKLTAIVGQVGAGKSSLISAMLGEMKKIIGTVNTKGCIAYVPQQAWIQNTTLKNNILFGKPCDLKSYSKVLDACALKPDLTILPGGDKTEIGEKGINLSGGQKQRVSLARAVYSDMDLYLLDDPLSAVDSHVGKHIFDKVIGRQGLLKDKTRILVTHGITFLPQADQIVVLKDGSISEIGTYKELLARKGAFADFLMQQLEGEEVDAEKASDEEIMDLKSQLEDALGKEEYQRKFSRQHSHLSESQSQDNCEGESMGNESKISRNGSVNSLLDKSNGSARRRSSTKERPKLTDGARPQSTPSTKLIEAETSKTGKVNFGVYFHYLRSIGPLLSITTISLYVISQSFGVYSNIWLAKWSKANITDDSTRDLYLGIYSALGFGQAIFTLVGAITMALGTLVASQYLHKLMLERILRCPMSFFDTTPIGRIVNRFAKDVDTVDNALPNTIRSALTCFLAVLAIVIVVGLGSPVFFIVVTPIGFLYYWIQHIYVATSRQLRRLESVSRSPIYSHFSETLTGASVIRAYGQQQRFVEESEAKVDTNQVCYYPSIIANRWLAIRLETIGNLVVLFASLFAVIGRDTIEPGLVGLSITYALNITQTLNWLMRMTSEIETNIVAVERIKEYCEVQQEAPDSRRRQPPEGWPDSGCVRFENYQLRYREGLDLVLKGISFDIEGGEKVGIVGRTGAGKSSLTLALFRIIEAAGGSITIDGMNISELGLSDLRSRITIIPQDPVLFSGTLRMNLDPFNSYKDDEIWEALEHAHLKSFVKSLATGLHHEVSEGGENLSVGQRQLICLARALLRKTKLLILDEATAAVDLQTDDLIQTTIRKEFNECTVITIAHRLNTILDYHKVLVLDEGKIQEYAPSSELLANKQSLFYGMARDAGLV